MQDNTSGARGYAIAVDVGGTFVDLTMCSLDTGERWIAKVLSSRGSATAFIDGMNQVIEAGGVRPDEVTRVVHGTTLATNAVLESRPNHTVLVTTENFRDVLEIGRHDAPREGNLYRWLKPPRPVPRDQIVEARERIAADGSVTVSLDADERARVVAEVKDLKPDSVAISFLHAHTNPEHERLLKADLRRELGIDHVSCSHEVLPQVGEYERTMAAVLNAYVQPAISDYLRSLQMRIKDAGVDAPLYIMASDGGIISADDAAELPIHTLLSGPAGGAAGAAAFSMAVGRERIVTLDVGGTSSDVACSVNGHVDLTVEGTIGDFPIAFPVLDVFTVGSGGGSLADRTTERFSVGPQSAGAIPGPACYGQGGTRPTVTDAHLALGRLPTILAGGAVVLDPKASGDAIHNQLLDAPGTGPLSDPDAMANGVLELADSHMVQAIRQISTERGRDPRDFSLFAFGGAGGLHAASVGRQLGVRSILVPPAPGVFTTEGLLAADLSRYFVSSLIGAPELDDEVLDSVRVLRDQLRNDAIAWLRQDSAVSSTELRTVLDLRYSNQGTELLVSVDDDQFTVEHIAQGFKRLHHERYTYVMEGSPIEVVRVRVAAVGHLAHAPRPQLDPLPPGPESARRVHFSGQGWVETAVVRRDDQRLFQGMSGPVIVEDYDSTTVVPPGFSVVLVAGGCLEIVADSMDVKE